MLLRRQLIGFFVLCFGFALPAQAVVFTADNLNDELNFQACTPAKPDHCSLRTALIWANSLAGQDTIKLVKGTYLLNGTNGQGSETDMVGKDNNPTRGDLDVSSPLIIIGKGMDDSLINGVGADRVFDIQSNAKSVRFENLQIVGGETSGNGAGIRVEEKKTPVNLVLKQVKVKENTAVNFNALRHGGGIYFCSGSLYLEDSVVVNNGANGDGAGIFSGCGSQLSMQRTLVELNHTGRGAGGGIAMRDGVLWMLDTEVRNNWTTAQLNGGGVSIEGGEATLWNVTLAANRAWLGGGLANRNADTTLINSTVSGNFAHAIGGGLVNSIEEEGEAKALNLIHVTITDNTSSTDDPSQNEGGGLYNMQGFVNMRGTLLADQAQGKDCLDTDNQVGTSINSFGFNIDSDNSCGLIPANKNGTDKVGIADVKIAALGNNGSFTRTHALLAGSPAVNVVKNDAWTPKDDQRGASRDAKADVGAFELIIFNFK